MSTKHIPNRTSRNTAAVAARLEKQLHLATRTSPVEFFVNVHQTSSEDGPSSVSTHGMPTPWVVSPSWSRRTLGTSHRCTGQHGQLCVHRPAGVLPQAVREAVHARVMDKGGSQRAQSATETHNIDQGEPHQERHRNHTDTSLRGQASRRMWATNREYSPSEPAE